LQKLKKGYVLTSSAYTLSPKQLTNFIQIEKTPEIGDVVYGEVEAIGQHDCLENGQGRIHRVHNNSKGIFVYGNRYAPDCYEGIIPDHHSTTADLLARSGLIGKVVSKSGKAISPTQIKILGYVCDSNGNIINTTNHSLIKPKKQEKTFPRSKLILVVGTAMNSGKSAAAVA
jgi:hypothetical protein